jgi:hypothetical protein
MQADRLTDSSTEKQKHTNIYKERQRDGQTGRLATFRQIYRQAGRQNDRHTDIQTDRLTDRQADRQEDRLQNIYQNCIAIFCCTVNTVHMCYIFPSVCLSVCPSVCLSVCLSACLPAGLPACKKIWSKIAKIKKLVTCTPVSTKRTYRVASKNHTSGIDKNILKNQTKIRKKNSQYLLG